MQRARPEHAQEPKARLRCATHEHIKNEAQIEVASLKKKNDKTTGQNGDSPEHGR